MKKIFALILTISFCTAGWGQSVKITQVENRRLLLNGTMDLFFLSRDKSGLPTELEGKPELYMSTTEGLEKKIKIDNMEQRAPERQGISFLLLMDNSGSMHTSQEGKTSRYKTAEFAAGEFLNSIDNPLDRVGLAAFNTYYRLLSRVSMPGPELSGALNSIKPPDREESYTELYLAMEMAVAELSEVSGRRALIVLSDGENYPYSLSGNPNPEYGKEYTDPESLLSIMVQEGISVYAVNIGEEKDPMLNSIALRSGGRSFSTVDGEKLEEIYRTIREEILEEYRISFRPVFSGTETGTLTLKYGNTSSDFPFYIPFFLGSVSGGFRIWMLIPAAAAAALLIFLLMSVWEKEPGEAEIRILEPSGAFTRAPRTIVRSSETVIGAGAEADMTISGNPALRERHATVVYSEKENSYTIQSDAEFRVNNQFRKKHKLRSGDVVDLNGTVVVFDKPGDD